MSLEIDKAVAQKAVSYNLKNVNDVERALNSKVSIFSPDTKTPQQQKQAYMQYSQRMLDTYYDKDSDGVVTKGEFEAVELDGIKKMSEILGFGDDAEVDAQARQMANLFAQKMDINSDNQISYKELTLFNEIADMADGAQDGVITAAGETYSSELFMKD